MPKARTKLKAGFLTGGKPNKREEAVLNFANRCDSFLYDFEKDGGTASTDVEFKRSLPAGAIVKGITADIQTAVTGAVDATIDAGSTSLTAATDLTALSGIATIALTDTDGIKLTEASELKLAIATAATAGKVRFFVEYLMPNE